jgi:hypothetical protein
MLSSARRIAAQLRKSWSLPEQPPAGTWLAWLEVWSAL